MNRLLFFILFPLVCFGQNEYNHWFFGGNARIDFNSGSPQVGGASAMSVLEGSASVADCDGDLLFYTDGETVWTAGHSVMENGYDLKGEGAIYPSTQGALIVKRPKSSSIYYVFTASDIFGLNYSVINMAANGGAGTVLQKNIGVDSKPTQKLAVTYHANGEDIWVATHYENSNEYEAFLITKAGVSSNSVISYTGPAQKGAHGDMKFNQTGTKAGAVVQDQNLVSIADFNNATGVFSNGFGIAGTYRSPHGVEFSPNGNWMYVSAWDTFDGGVIQFNTLLGNFSMLSQGQKISGSFEPKGSLQLAPDGRIYVADDQSLWLGVISSPNNAGTGAGFSRFGLNLGGRKSSWELPNVTLVNNIVIEPNGIVASNFCEDDTTLFSLQTDVGVVSVLWDFDDPNSASNNSVSYNPQHVFSSPGDYDVLITVNTICGTEVYNRIISIDAGPEFSLTDTTYCENSQQTIGIDPVVGDTYNWTPSTGLSSNTSSNPILDLSLVNTPSTLYVLTSTSAKGCTASDTLFIDVLSLPQAGADQLMCPGFDVGLNLDSSAFSVLWSPSNNIDDHTSLNPIVSPGSSLYYYAEITDTNGCVNTDSVFVFVKDSVPVNAGFNKEICFGDTVEIGVIENNLNIEFLWLPNQNILNEDSSIARVFPTVNFEYYLVASIDTCSNRDTVSIEVNSLPIVQVNPQDTSVCFGDEFKLSANGANTYSWWVNGGVDFGGAGIEFIKKIDQDEVIVLEGVDSNGCINQDTSTVSLLNLPELLITADTNICVGKSIGLAISGAKSYLWSNIDVAIPTDSLIIVSPPVSIYYHVKAQGGNGCFSEDSVFVKVNNLPQIEITKDTVVCEGQVAKLWANGGKVYEWSPTDSFSIASNRVHYVKVPISVEYKVVVTDSNACVDSSTVFVSTNVIPEAGFTFDTIPDCDGINILFSNESVNGESFQWVFGDGTTSSNEDADHIYKYGSSQSAFLVVGNNNICFDTLSVNLDFPSIDSYINTVIPNIITPNFDGENDCFEFELPVYYEDCAVLEVYNRWGLKVHDSSVFKTNFCGINSYNNKVLSKGTYFYTLTFGEYEKNGFITIVK